MAPQRAHDQRDALQLLDVREADELVLAKFPGALHIPMDQIPGRLHELDRTTPVAVICRSGNRSAHVTDYLDQLGFHAHNVDGGLREWIRAGSRSRPDRAPLPRPAVHRSPSARSTASSCAA